MCAEQWVCFIGVTLFLWPFKKLYSFLLVSSSQIDDRKKNLSKLSCSIYWLPWQRLNALDTLFAVFFFSHVSLLLCFLIFLIFKHVPQNWFYLTFPSVYCFTWKPFSCNLSKVHSFVRSNVSTIFSNFQNSLMIWLSLCGRWKDIFNWKKYFSPTNYGL